MQINTMTDVLRYILEQYETDILLDGTRCIAIIADLAPTMKQEKKLMQLAFDSDFVKILVYANSRNDLDKQLACSQFYNKLVNTVFLNEVAALQICTYFIEAMNWKVDLSEIALNKASEPELHKSSIGSESINCTSIIESTPGNSTLTSSVSVTQKEEQEQQKKQKKILPFFLVFAVCGIMIGVSGTIVFNHFMYSCDDAVLTGAELVYENTQMQTEILTETTIPQQTVPELRYQLFENAETILSSMGFHVKTEYTYSEDIPKNYIISQDIVAGTLVADGTSITLTISLGTKAATTTISKKTSVTTTITETTSGIISPIFISGEDGYANIVNGGYACTDSYNYYFSDVNGLYCMDNQSTFKTLITNRVFYLNIVQDTLFFVNADQNNALCTIKTDGTGYQVLLNEYCYELTYYEGWLYFNRMMGSSNAICRIKPDGTGLTVLMECYEWYMSIAENTIYFCNYDDGYKLYAMNTDGTNRRVIYDGECSDFCIVNNRIYFSSDRTSRNLCSMNLDGTDFQQLTTTYTKHTNYHKGKIYFVSDDGKLYTCNPDGSNITKYTDETMTYPVLTPGIIFYEDKTSKMLMMPE